MYLRESSRRNKDGSKVTYLQLAHNERHPVTGSPVAKVIHNFGRKDKVDKEALARLVSSISRVLDLPMTDASVASADVEIVDSRRLGGALRPRPDVGSPRDRRCAAVCGSGSSTRRRARRADLLRPRRPALPGAGLQARAVAWANERVAIPTARPSTTTPPMRRWTSFLPSLPEIAERIFSATANLLNLSCDIIFVDTSSTYFERDVADGEDDLDLAESAEEKAASQSVGA